MKKVLAGLILAVSGVSALATTELNKTIAGIGAQGNLAYIYVTPAPAGASGCIAGAPLYIRDTSTAAGKAQFAVLLSAYSADLPLKRVDFAVDSSLGNNCTISLIEQ